MSLFQTQCPNARMCPNAPQCPNLPVLSFPFARMSESASSLLPFCPNALLPEYPNASHKKNVAQRSYTYMTNLLNCLLKKMMSGVHIVIRTNF